MAEFGALEAMQALHRELLSICEHRLENLHLLEQSLQAHTEAFKKLLDKPAKAPESRKAVNSRKIKIAAEEYTLNPDFVESALRLADELDLDEIEAAKVLLEAEGDQLVLGRSLLECGIIRFHQYRNYLLDSIRLCIQIANDDRLEDGLQDGFSQLAEHVIFGVPVAGAQASSGTKFIPRCMAAMKSLKDWLQRIAEKLNATNLTGQAKTFEFQEAIEFSRVSIIQQHELLAVIMCSAIEKGQAEAKDFREFTQVLRKIDKYDNLLVHLFPAVGAYITRFGSAEGVNDLSQAREFHQIICKHSDDDTWSLIYLRASFRAWWIAEYSGFYMDDVDGIPGVDLDVEDAERTRLFVESAKDGAFDFLLSVAADCKATDWQDPVRSGIQQWLQRKSPPLSSDPVPFSDFFQHALMVQLEVFIDAFISNLPDILRKLRTEEDEQRQLSHSHEQDLDLERFLIIIAYSYEGRPDAAMSFWEDPDSNLAGFLNWASKRASTPLVSAFCEMLQSLSDNEQCATAAHNFLLDEGHHASGKMRRSQSLTWGQIFKELWYFIRKIQEKHSPAQLTYRGGKPTAEQAETEPESAMMLECYLRLMAKLATESESARLKLLVDTDFNLVGGLMELTSSMIPARLRASAFYVLKALMTRASQEECYIMWKCVDSWVAGGYALQPNRGSLVAQQQEKAAILETTLRGLSESFEEANAFIQFLTSLTTPARTKGPDGLQNPLFLYDTLPFPEDLGNAVRMGGIEPYVDFVLHVFAVNSRDTHDVSQLRILRLSCLEFALTSLATFNEDLIILGNEGGIAIDAAISTKDLSTYVRFHPFARVMEWMFNDKVIDALFQTIHQDPTEVGNASPESPLIQGILRGVEIMLKVLELQATYLDLVRPIVKLHPDQRQQLVANSAYASFEDGIMGHLGLIVDLGRYCAIGHPDLTMACLKLLEKISISSRIISAWNPESGQHGHRNKAIVALERNSEAEAISVSLVSELTATLDFGREAETPNYIIKNHILEFLYECLKATPDQPTIAHLLLGFRCGINTLEIESGGAFDTQTSLFHSLLNVFLEVPTLEEERGVRSWLLVLKYKIMRVFHVLWNSPLSSALVLDELRSTKFLFHLLLREIQIQPHLVWDGFDAGSPDFLATPASISYINFLSMRAMAFEYVGRELCSVSQQRIPMVKRQIFDALGGHIKGDDGSAVNIPNVFDFYDFLSVDGLWNVSSLQFEYFKDLDLSSCAEDTDLGLQYDIRKIQELLALKQNESRMAGLVVPQADLSAIEREEALVIEYVNFSNRQKQLAVRRLQVLKAWVNLVLVMLESNEFKGATKMSFLLQALQAILPSLEKFSADNLPEAFELTQLARVLLFKLDVSRGPTASLDGSRGSIGNLVSDKLFQLFQICLNAVGKWAGDARLRAIYYSICYRYVTSLSDDSQPILVSNRSKAVKAVAVYGERLLNVVCDDAYGGDTGCQTAAVIFLSSLVHLSQANGDEDDTHVVGTLNRLNFIGVLVDSLRGILGDWLGVLAGGADQDSEQLINAKLALLLQLCQTKWGAKFVLQANLFRALELSGVFAADPELEIDGDNTAALEKHYSLLVRLARIVSAAVLARGSHNVLQGRRFLSQHRMLVMHTLKRSAGIGTVGIIYGTEKNSGLSHAKGDTGAGGDESRAALEERIEELAEAFMLLITATGFLEFEDNTSAPTEKLQSTAVLFH